jgi:hypothetical protein
MTLTSLTLCPVALLYPGSPSRLEPEPGHGLWDGYPTGDFLARLDLRERLLQAPDAPWWSELNAVLPLAG